MYAFIVKMIKFGLVGLMGMVIDFGITWLCKEKLKWNKYVANSCGFTLGSYQQLFSLTGDGHLPAVTPLG